MKNMRIIMLIIMSLFMKSLCITTIERSSEQGQKIKAIVDEVARKQEARKAQEAEEARRQEEAARKQEEERKETQKKIDELKVQEDKAQEEREAEKRKKMEETPKHIMDALGDLFTAAKKYAVAEKVIDAERDENIKSGNALFKKFGQELYDALNFFPSEKVKENISIIVKKMELKPENRFMILRNLVEAYSFYPKMLAADHMEMLLDFIEVLFKTFSSNELQTIASKVSPQQFNDTMHNFAVHLAAVDADEPLFEAIKQFSEHVIAATTNPDLLFFWFNTVPFDKPLTEEERKNKKDPHFELKKLIEKIDFTKFPANVHQEIYRRWIDFFKKIRMPLPKTLMRKCIDSVKAIGNLSDYHDVIESFRDSMPPLELFELQFDLLGKLEEHPEWLKKSTADDQKFLADMMKTMTTDLQLPKSGISLFNLIRTVKSVIDDPALSKNQKEQLKTLSNALADDIVPTLDWKRRWSDKISSFFDKYLPWRDKSKTYKPHWISWPPEQRRMIYGITSRDWSHSEYIYNNGNAFWQPMFRENNDVGQKALDWLLEIRDWYQPKEQYALVHQILKNDAHEIFGHIFEIHKVFDFVKNDVNKQELLFDWVPFLGEARSGSPSFYGKGMDSDEALIELFENAIKNGTLSFNNISDKVVEEIARRFGYSGIMAKIGSMSDHQLDILVSMFGLTLLQVMRGSRDINEMLQPLADGYRSLSDAQKKASFERAVIQFLENSVKELGHDGAQWAVVSFKNKVGIPT